VHIYDYIKKNDTEGQGAVAKKLCKVDRLWDDLKK
jgi:hypothetical protein